MTKSTDKSLIEDSEIPADDLVEDLVEDDDISDMNDDDDDMDRASIVNDEDDDDDGVDEDDTAIQAEKFVERRKPAWAPYTD